MEESKMRAYGLLLLACLVWSSMAVEHREEKEEWPFAREGKGKDMFLLRESRQVVKAEGGEVRVVMGYRWKGDPDPMNIGFISMEPNTVFLPQYLDSSLILFVYRGDARVGFIYKDELVVKDLKMGDINLIPAGSPFYMVNTGRGQRLQIISSIDSSRSLGWDAYQGFSVGGGINPPSVLSGFDSRTLATAFNISARELEKLEKGPKDPIVYMPYEDRLPLSKRSGEEKVISEIIGAPSTWRKMLGSFLSWTKEQSVKNKKDGPVRAPDSYNIFTRNPDFKNKYGWTLALDEDDYAPLKRSGASGTGVFLVNLTAGSMLAPHVNPLATEYAVVIGGSGTVQVVFPNGTAAMQAEVGVGDVFWVPRFFPFCQIASRSGPFEFFGFTSSSKGNRPQFLVGASSILRTMMGPEVAAGLGMTEEEATKIVKAQAESVILPSKPIPEEKVKGGSGKPLLESVVASN